MAFIAARAAVISIEMAFNAISTILVLLKGIPPFGIQVVLGFRFCTPIVEYIVFGEEYTSISFLLFIYDMI